MGEVIPFQRPEHADEILTRSELAERLKLSLRTIDRLVVQGMPSEKWGPRTRRFRWLAVNQWLTFHDGGSAA